MKRFALFIVLAIISLANLLSQSCLPQGIIFTTQAQIDSFQINYPGCTEIEGDVEIIGDSITKLKGLTVLTSIGGALILGGEYNFNPALVHLKGLYNLTSIGDDLVFLTALP